MAKRSNLLVATGLTVFVAGAGVSLVVLADRQAAVSGPPAGATSVLYATTPIPAGTAGATAAAQGMVRAKRVDSAAVPPDALVKPSQLANKVSAGDVPEGQILTAGHFAPPQTRIGTVRIPPGKTALAVQLSNVPGVAGFAGAGDRINVYALQKADSSGPAGAGARLVMQGVEVLNVNGSNLTPTQGQPGGAGIVFLLAVTPEQAERLVFLTGVEQLYLSLVPADQPPVPSTPGVRAADALKPLS